jgi:sensor histidine kinase regulating citrate/malate metabolism
LLDNNNIRSGKNGLGLYLIRDIAKIIGAEISIIHASKAGTTFLISL